MIFISHAQEDKSIALRVVNFLENEGFKCWITPRDISLGDDWAEAIITAIENCEAVVLMLSSSSNASPHVRREIEHSVSLCKKIIPLVIEDVKLSKWMKYCISIHQWHDACNGTLDLALPALLSALSTGSDIDKRISTANQIDEELSHLSNKTHIHLEPSELKPLIVASIKLPISNTLPVKKLFYLLGKLAAEHSGILIPGDDDSRLRCFFGVSKPIDSSLSDAVSFAKKAFHLIKKLFHDNKIETGSVSDGIGLSAGMCEISWLGDYRMIRGSAIIEADALSVHGKLYASQSCHRLNNGPDWNSDARGYLAEESVNKENESDQVPFTGREDILKTLSDLLKKQRISSEMNRRGGAVHIVQGIQGEAGMGKTCLINKFIMDFSGSLNKIIYPSITAADAAELTGLTEYLSSKFELQEKMNPGSNSDKLRSSESENLKLVHYSAVRDSFTLYADKGLIFIIDDAQKLNSADNELLKFLVESTDSRKPILFLLLYRKTDHTGRQVKFSFSGSFSSCSEIELHPMSSRDTTFLMKKLLNNLSGDSALPTDDFAETVFRKTGGNPFFIAEVMREYFKNNRITLDTGEWKLRSETDSIINTLPLSSIINASIDSLPKTWKRTLQLCAVMGDRLPSGILGKVKRSIPDKWFSIEGLNYLTERHFLIREQTAFEDTYRFRHDLLREAALSGITTGNGRMIHRAVAEAFEFLFTDNESYHLILAEHWHYAGDNEKTLEWGSKALDYCIRSFKYDDALRWITILKTLKKKREFQELVLRESNILGFLGRNAERISLLEKQLEENTSCNPEYTSELHLHLGTMRQEKGEIETAEIHLRRALEELHGNKSKELEAEIKLTLGSLLVDTGCFDESTSHLDEALAFFRKTGSEHEVARIKKIQGDLKFRTGETQESINLYKEGLEIARVGFDKKLQLDCLSSLGQACLQLGKYDTASKYWEEDIEVASVLGNRLYECIATRHLGSIQYVKGNLDNALSKYIKSYEIAKEIDDKRNMGAVLRNMSYIHARRGQIDKAIEILKESEQLADASVDLKAKAETLHSLGALYDDINNTDKAITIYHECTEIARISGSISMEAMAQGNLANCLQRKGKLAEALPVAKQALLLLKNVNEVSSVICAHSNLAVIQIPLGMLDDAYQNLIEGLEIAEEINDTSYRPSLLATLSNYFIHRKEYDTAFEFSEKAYKSGEELENVPNARAYAGILYSYLLLKHCNKTEEAENILNDIVHLCENMDLLAEEANVAFIRGLIAHRRGAYKQAQNELELGNQLINQNSFPKHFFVGLEELTNVLSD